MLSIIISITYVTIAFCVFWRVSDGVYKDDDVSQAIDDEGAWVHILAFILILAMAAFWPLSLVWANFDIKKDKNV